MSTKSTTSTTSILSLSEKKKFESEALISSFIAGNVMILALSFGLLGVSSYGQSNYDQLQFRRSTDQEIDLLTQFSQSFGLQANISQTNTTLGFFLPERVSTLALPELIAFPLLAIGWAVCFSAGCGLCVGCCFRVKLFWIYFVALLIIVVGEISGIVWMLKSNDNLFYKVLKNDMKRRLQRDFVSFESDEPKSVIWTLTMLEGCYPHLKSQQKKWWFVILAMALSVACLQVCLLVLSLMTIRIWRKEKGILNKKLALGN